MESSVISKLDHGCVVFYPLPEYQMKRLQRVQTTCAGYVLGRYAVWEDLQKINWLIIIKRRDLALLKITQKALYDDVWPDYLRLKFHAVSGYNLRSLEAPKLAITNESGTFQDSTARLFNTLPDKLRQEPNYSKFVRLAKKLMFSEGESVWLIFIIIITINHAVFYLYIFFLSNVLYLFVIYCIYHF